MLAIETWDYNSTRIKHKPIADNLPPRFNGSKHPPLE